MRARPATALNPVTVVLRLWCCVVVVMVQILQPLDKVRRSLPLLPMDSPLNS